MRACVRARWGAFRDFSPFSSIVRFTCELYDASMTRGHGGIEKMSNVRIPIKVCVSERNLERGRRGRATLSATGLINVWKCAV